MLFRLQNICKRTEYWRKLVITELKSGGRQVSRFFYAVLCIGCLRPAWNYIKLCFGTRRINWLIDML